MVVLDRSFYVIEVSQSPHSWVHCKLVQERILAIGQLS
jgi:hypothetical protein